MSRFLSSQDNLFDGAEYYHQFDLPIDDGPNMWYDEGFTQTMQQFLSDSHEDGISTSGQQRTSAEWLYSNDPSRWQGFPIEGHDAHYGGVIDPALAVSHVSAEPTNDSRIQSSEPYIHLSKRAAKRADLEARGIEFGTELTRKGAVMEIDGVLHVYYEDEWRPAVYHQTLRAEMIAAAPPELYLHTPARGIAADDVTSFWEPHRTWGFNVRANRPKVLFEWLPLIDRSTPEPGPMMHNGQIVIDLSNHPVRDWAIPLCLSSEVEAGRLEAMTRENGNRLSKRDIRARMPSTVVKRNGRNIPPISEHAIAMRRTRFRDQAGLLSWNPRDGSLGKKRALIQCIPADIMGQILATNDTSCFRDLTQEEMTFIDRANRGLNPEKAGSRQLSANERERRLAVKDVKLKNFEPINETAWPYMDSPDNDDLAISRARMKLGLPPLESDHAQEFHGAPVNDEKTENHPGGSTHPAINQVVSTCGRKKRLRDEDLGSPSTDGGDMRTKRRCDSADLEKDGLSSAKIGSSEYLVASSYDDEVRHYAEYLSFKPRQAPRATSPDEPHSATPNFAHNILQGEETREIDSAKAPGSIAPAITTNAHAK
ncbi:MAG: hypothetical protein Q9196_002177 [Gyalolechia fulgens]